ncbi:sugar phosphate isomerase/epimerase family protein [Dactylosporangium sucinum]|uniref:sugar phosphate isomerase/epimerase family protein n=1 Tax=Dactylosporangium sucinum TaxID=1424081 RepID=UPI00167CD7A7
MAEQLVAAEHLGYHAMSISLDTVAAAEESGMPAAELARRAAGHGVRLAVLEPVVTWLPVDPRWAMARHDLDRVERYGEALGVSAVCVLAGSGLGLSIDEIADRYAALCRRFAAHGWRTCIEFAPMSGIRDLPEARRLTTRADPGTAGVIFDTWHFCRGAADLADLAASGAGLIDYVQVSDAARAVSGSLGRDTYHRLLPGEGSFDLAGVLGVLRGLGALGAVGPEVITPAFAELTCVEAARRATEATERHLAAAEVVAW